MLKPLITAALLCCAALSQNAFSADTAAGLGEAGRAETIVLGVTLNTEDKGQFFINRTADGDLLVKIEDLRAMGFKEPAGSITLIEGEPHVALKSMAGVAFVLQEKTLVLEITAEPHLLPKRAINFRSAQPARVFIPSESSAFFNYSANYATGDAYTGSGAGLAGELGIRAGEYLFLTDGNSIQPAGSPRKTVRLMSSLTHDNRDTLQRFVLGDFYTPAHDLGAGLNLGGIGVTKLYQMNPYFIRYPLQTITGKVAFPTDMEILVNGQRIRTEALKPGEFELRDIANYGGAQSVQVILRDPFGRVQEISYPFYFSEQPLQQGLHEYSYNAGTLRRNFSTDSNNYGPPAFSFFHRYGMSDALTLGFRAEGKQGLRSGGPLATYVLGSAGILNLALSASKLDNLEGFAGLLGYGYQSRNWNMGLTARRDTRNYTLLTDPATLTNRKYEGSAVVGYHLPGLGALSLSHSALITDAGHNTATAAPQFNFAPLQNRRASTLSYSAPIISGSASFSVSLNHIREKETRNEIFVSLVSYFRKDHSAAANYQKINDSHVETLQFTRNQPIGEGLGYRVLAERSGSPGSDSYRLNPTFQYNAPGAILRGEYGRRQDATQSAETYQASVAGGLAYVGGDIKAGRPVTDSFAIVSVGELEGVKVSVNGQEIGTTDAQGKAFVPTLSSYSNNQVSISPENVPIEYSFSETSRNISPSLRSGAMINFGVTRIQAVSGKLKSRMGTEEKPVEFHEIMLGIEDSVLRYPTGHGGEFYLENLKPGTYPAAVEIEGKRCVADLTVPKSEEPFIDVGELVCRPAP